MPTVNTDFRRSVTRLDTSGQRSGIFTPDVAALVVDEDALRRFNEIALSLAPGLKPFAPEQIIGAARRVMRAVAKGQDPTFIKVRMRRAGEIRAMYKDSMWDITPELVAPVRALIAYFDDPVGLIPNTTPVVGSLDDALLVDIAMETLRSELDEYADFCRYRCAEAARLDIAPQVVPLTRELWADERAQEVHLEQQLRRMRGSPYAQQSSLRGFRIC